MRAKPRRHPARPPTVPLVLVVLAATVTFTAATTMARGNAQQPDQETAARLLASPTPDRANPVPLADAGAIQEPVFIFVNAPATVAWVAFYLDLDTPEGLAAPYQVERHEPYDLAGTLTDGQAAPLDPTSLGGGTHRITAILHTPQGGQELLTATIQIGTPDCPAPTPGPPSTLAPAPTTAPEPTPSPAEPPPTTIQPAPAPTSTTIPAGPDQPCPPPTTRPLQPNTETQAFGLHQDLHYGVADGQITAAAELGATISRSSFLWDKIEPVQGQRDWSATDAFITELTEAGIEPLLVLVGSPSWANGSDDRFVVPTDPAEFDTWMAAYADFAREAAARYQEQVSRWELWNEPNERFFWKPDQDPDRYHQWYVAVRAAMLEANPNAQLAVGGLTGLTASCCIRGIDFLTRLLETDTPMDAVAIHPYPGQGQAPGAQLAGEMNFTDIQTVRQVLEDAGRAEVPLWVTEWGWSTSQVGADTQARYVADSLRMLQQQFPYVTVATYFLDYDRPQFDHGLLDANLQPKPAADAFADAVQNPVQPEQPEQPETPEEPETPEVPAPPEELGDIAVQLEPVASLEGALAMHAPEGSDAIYVATQQGTIHLLRDGQLEEEPALDLTGEVIAGGEQGLLGLAVSPDRQFVYVNLTNLAEDTSIREYALDSDGRADPGSMRELLVIDDFAANHNGGQMAFGPDGMLYIATGDGGGAGDPERTAQDLGSLLGKILRIDPTASGDEPYGIPGDNPFVGTEGARGEVYAYGLRNPWRFSFDRASGDLWIGDVGQNAVEEVDVVPAGSGGGQNFGWSLVEGTSEYYGAAPEGAVDPVIEYPHDGGACTVIGGEVYRGTEIPGFQGAYIYGDYCAGWVRAVATSGAAVAGEPRDLGVNVPQLAAFGADQNGDLYALSLSQGVLRLVPGSPGAP